MVRRGHKAALAKLIPEYAHGAIYALVSGIVLLATVVLWQPTGTMLFELQGFWRWAVRGVFFLAIAGMAWGVSVLEAFDPFGVGAIQARMSALPSPTAPFALKGPYLWVRHPLYFFVLVMLWSCPDLSTDRVLFNLLWSIWICIGSVLEEKDLVSDFGEDYIRYQRRVPMLIPWKIPYINRH
jgi:protein-S-isoprenylcysteine O-methyltransferase Ste14